MLITIAPVVAAQWLQALLETEPQSSEITHHVYIRGQFSYIQAPDTKVSESMLAGEGRGTARLDKIG
jgi:hypothetical protein